MNDDLAASMFPSMARADTASAPAPSTTPDQEAQLQAAFPSMYEQPAPERPAAPQATSTPPTSDAPPTETAASRASEPTDAAEPTPIQLGTAGIEISLPAGLAPDVLALQEVDGIASELGLDGAAVQRFVDVHSQAMERAVDAAEQQITEDWAKVTRGWATSAEKDAEIGGAGFKENLALARQVLDRYGPGFKAAAKELGIGNHPELVRLLVRVGKALGTSASTRADDAAARSAFKSMT